MPGSNWKPRRTLLAVLLATLAVFGALVVVMTWQLRSRLREEVLRREAEAIHAVAMMQLAGAQAKLPGFDGADLVDPLFTAVLASSRLRGVFAVQLFDPAGTLRESEPLGADAAAEVPWWPNPLGAPRVRFLPHGSLELVYGFPTDEGTTSFPLLDVVVPLQPDPQATPLGTARYWLDGRAVAAEFARTDRRLLGQAGAAYLGGALLVVVVLFWGMRRVADAHRQLEAQSADLARANQELDFAAKTGAIGAISAHLIHGLKNPLSGLEGYVAESAPEDPHRGEAWRMAVDTTRRLRNLVNEVVVVLRDEASGDADYQVPVREVTDAARSRAAVAAERSGVALALPPPQTGTLKARTANLVGLILDNLLRNAIEASSTGQTVQLAVATTDERVEFSVHDQGAGLPESVRQVLFRPLRSSKPGGGGIGLAISHQLARHAGGSLELTRSDGMGSVFTLVVPNVGRRPSE
jgi:signal transduction histidine kinase